MKFLSCIRSSFQIEHHVLYFFTACLLQLVCLVFWGCGESTEFKWQDGRGTGNLAGFIDDSLVVVMDCREWLETIATWNGAYSEESSCGHDRMLVFNYRVQESGPRWTDSITNKSGDGIWLQLTDSIFWRFDENDIMLWKVGQKAHRKSIFQKLDGCSNKFTIEEMHQWLDEKFIALGDKSLKLNGDSCQYAILDTVSKTLVYKRLGDSLSWIEKCDDVRALENDIYCLAIQEEPISILLYYKNTLADSINHPEWHREYLPYRTLQFDGNMVQIQSEIYGLDFDKRQIKDGPAVYVSSEIEFNDALGVTFTDSLGVTIKY